MQHNLIIFNNVLSNAQSLTADFTSSPQDISNIRSYSVQGKYTLTSASAETILVEGSDYPTDTDMWTTITSFSLSSTSGTFLLNAEFPAYTHIRIKYTKGFATGGTTTIRVTGKI